MAETMPAPTIEEAIDALRRLTPERQQELAPYICYLANEEPKDINPADLPSVLEGMAQAERRKYATDQRVAAVSPAVGN